MGACICISRRSDSTSPLYPASAIDLPRAASLHAADDQLVLIWQYRFGTDALSLEIPGGVIDPGEDPERAARRELSEETGYDAEVWSPLVCVEPNPAIQNNRCSTYLALGAHAATATHFDPQEEIETALVPASRIAELLDGGQVTHALAVCALETYWRRRQSGALGAVTKASSVR